MARVRFDGFLKDLLLLELRSIARARAVIGDGASVIRVIDSGVFIAKFRVTAALQAARTGLKAAITAFEANSALADPIRTHLALLGVEIAVHANGIGAGYGTLPFSHSAGRLTGGTLFMPTRKEDVGPGATTHYCAFILLHDALPPQLAPRPGPRSGQDRHQGQQSGCLRGDLERINNLALPDVADDHRGRALWRLPAGRLRSLGSRKLARGAACPPPTRYRATGGMPAGWMARARNTDLLMTRRR